MKEIVLGLLAIGTAPYSASKIEDVLGKQPVPIEQKIHALEVASDKNSIEDIPPPKSDSQIKAIASTLIKPVEIYGTDISEPRNKRFLRPYKDDTGIYTIGIGHKIGDGSRTDKNKWVKKDRKTHV